MFIAIDGGDGSGKGLQLEFLKSWFKELRLNFVFFHDPGDTTLGEIVRYFLLKCASCPTCTKAETALFMAARAQLVQDKVQPALARGKIVLVDRFLLSSVVYQGYAVGANNDDITRLWQMGKYITEGIIPSITFVLNCPVEVSFQRTIRRMKGQVKDRIESRCLEYHRRVSDGYIRAINDWKKLKFGEVYLIDATLKPNEVFSKIKAILQPRLT